MHGGARGAYITVAVLLILLVITIPVSIWMFIRVSGASITIGPDRLVVRGFLTKTWMFADIRRLGVLQVPVAGGGIGGVIARKKCGGPTAYHLCRINAAGKKSHFMVSQYTRHNEIISRVAASVGLRIEDVKMGALGPKWA